MRVTVCSDVLLYVGRFNETSTHYCNREPGHAGKHGDGRLSWASVPLPKGSDE